MRESCPNFKTYFREATLDIDRPCEGSMSRMLMADANSSIVLSAPDRAIIMP